MQYLISALTCCTMIDKHQAGNNPDCQRLDFFVSQHASNCCCLAMLFNIRCNPSELQIIQITHRSHVYIVESEILLNFARFTDVYIYIVICIYIGVHLSNRFLRSRLLSMANIYIYRVIHIYIYI